MEPDQGSGAHHPTNRLIREKSPYLLQHARNPVDWYPWSDEAFAAARSLDWPVFLSIGYATCHWCHVMERESFEDPEVAALMNEAFVCVKVDREERPDIDGIYMTVCQMMTGSGGWPLTIIMTPEQKPFFAATYLPRQSAFGRVGMLDLIPRVRKLWKEQRQEVERYSDEVAGTLLSSEQAGTGDMADATVLTAAFDQLASRFDREHGGFGTAPKFPTPQNILFLHRYGKRFSSDEALRMAEKTLSAMRSGGICDHLGYGFHRYSTDRRWLVPHFEKMLYDQALLATAYLEAFQITGDERHARTVREILGYVLRDMTSDEGAFYSAEDADSEGEEGKYYVWGAEDIRRLLGAEAGLFSEIFGVSDSGNFAEEASGKKTGMSILHIERPLEETAAARGIDPGELPAVLESCRARLLAERQGRIRPLKDNKVLTDWNGLMISAFAKASRVLGEPRYLYAAQSAADFILKNLRDDRGRLLHRYRDGEAAVAGIADDYAFFIAGLLDLYEASCETRSLRAALDINELFLTHFWDHGSAGFFFTADDAESLLVRKKEIYDGAIPSSNSVALLNLLRLSAMTGNQPYAKQARELAAVFSATVREHPSAYGYFLCGLDFLLGPSSEVVIAGAASDPATEAMIAALFRPFIPNKAVLFRDEGDDAPIVEIAPFIRRQGPVGGRATAYVCRGFSCSQPVHEPAQMLALLDPSR